MVLVHGQKTKQSPEMWLIDDPCVYLLTYKTSHRNRTSCQAFKIQNPTVPRGPLNEHDES